MLNHYFKKTSRTCVLLHHQSHVANQAISFTDQERYTGAPQNSAQSQKCAVKISEIKKKIIRKILESYG